LLSEGFLINNYKSYFFFFATFFAGFFLPAMSYLLSDFEFQFC
jgi:hypothetical protein